MSELTEDRVYDADGEVTGVYVAAGMGVVRVEAAGDRIGRFGIDHRCAARDVAADGVVAVATDEDVLVRDAVFDTTGFGPAVAVGFRDERPVAADEDGRIATRDDGAWIERGTLDVEVRAVDDDLLATSAGVYRLGDADIERLGDADVRDVATGETPLAATGDGLYALDDEWSRVLDGAFQAVATSPSGVAHGASGETLYERRAGGWSTADLPVEESVVDVAYGECPYAVTGEGTLLTGDAEWRPHPLGVGDAVGIAASERDDSIRE